MNCYDKIRKQDSKTYKLITGSYPTPHQGAVHHKPAIYLRDGVQTLQTLPEGEASFPYRVHGQRQKDVT